MPALVADFAAIDIAASAISEHVVKHETKHETENDRGEQNEGKQKMVDLGRVAGRLW
jgi:hypothetical protein